MWWFGVGARVVPANAGGCRCWWRWRARDLLDVHHLLETGVDMDRELLERKLNYYELVMDGPTLEGALSEIGHIWKAELSPLVKGKMPDLESIREDVGRRLAGLL